MHGFVLFAVTFVMRDNFVMATILMVLAVNFKQTALYFALPFVVYVISRLTIIHHNPNVAMQIETVINRCVILGVVFAATNAIIWQPFLFPDLKLDLELATKVWNRVFPVRRGIFEDKVATFWCVIHYCTPLKPNNWFDRSFQFKMTMLSTFAACMPSCYFLYQAPTRKQLLYCLFCVTMSFFMFGFQVHEKQILSPSLIFVLLIGDLTEWMTLFTYFANFSMIMLYRNDN
jgi:alpha-1,3-glucosyltransferase